MTVNNKNMKNYFLIFFILLPIFAFSQNGYLLALGGSHVSLNPSHNDLVKDELKNYQSIYGTMEWITPFKLTIGIEGNYSLDNQFNFYDLKLKAGWILSRKNRLQIPIYVNIGFFGVEGFNEEKNRGEVYGLQGGLRFYITRKIAILGVYDTSFSLITRVDGDKVDPVTRSYGRNAITLALTYYINNEDDDF